jgi:hypothetical protein
MARPCDLPRDGWEHGTRSCYTSMKCRCDLCRKANREYAAERNRKAVEAAATVLFPTAQAPQVWTAADGTQKVRLYSRACPGTDGKGCPHKSHLRKDSKGGVCGECRKKLVWDGLVPAGRAREHLMALSGQNVGRRAVAAACDVGESILEDIRSGRKLQIRASTERRILSVDEKAVSDHALVPAGKTWKLVRTLIRKYGYTKQEIAEDLGGQALQLGRKHIWAVTELKVRVMYDEAVRTIEGYELAAKMSVRAEQLQRALPCSLDELVERLSYTYEGEAGKRKAYRDLEAIGATHKNGIWSIHDKKEDRPSEDRVA